MICLEGLNGSEVYVETYDIDVIVIDGESAQIWISDREQPFAVHVPRRAGGYRRHQRTAHAAHAAQLPEPEANRRHHAMSHDELLHSITAAVAGNNKMSIQYSLVRIATALEMIAGSLNRAEERKRKAQEAQPK